MQERALLGPSGGRSLLCQQCSPGYLHHCDQNLAGMGSGMAQYRCKPIVSLNLQSILDPPAGSGQYSCACYNLIKSFQSSGVSKHGKF